MNVFDKIERKICKIQNNKYGEFVNRKVLKSVPQYGLTSNEKRVVVSMATYKERYQTIIPTLKSLLLQTYKPDKIIVWLDENVPENRITKEMQMYKKYGIEYRHTTEGLKPHKKYFYAMQEFSDAIIITVDDDSIYSKDLIESLMKQHERYPNCICARRVHKIQMDATGKIKPYKNWIYECRKEKEPSYLLCATGDGGVLYPPNIMPTDTFNSDAIKSLCLCADDIWLKFMELKAGIKVSWAPSIYVMPYETKNSQRAALNTTNTNAGGNDLYIKNLLRQYPEVVKYLKEENKR